VVLFVCVIVWVLEVVVSVCVGAGEGGVCREVVWVRGVFVSGFVIVFCGGGCCGIGDTGGWRRAPHISHECEVCGPT